MATKPFARPHRRPFGHRSFPNAFTTTTTKTLMIIILSHLHDVDEIDKSTFFEPSANLTWKVEQTLIVTLSLDNSLSFMAATKFLLLLLFHC
jgi:hypothetical protein